MSEEAVALRTLVADAVADADLLAHVSLLADAGLPILISGPSRTLTSRVADAIALASPVPGAAESGREIVIESGHHFEWLADPTGIGCMDPLAGSAPRSARSSRLRIAGLLGDLDPVTARAALRALSRGFPALIEARGTGLAELLDALRADPHRVPEDDLRRLGVVLCLDETNLTAAHLMRSAETGDRRPPALLAVWDGTRAVWDDFAWAAVPELAERCGVPQAAYEVRHAERLQILEAGELQ
jgi:hypothetical protein